MPKNSSETVKTTRINPFVQIEINGHRKTPFNILSIEGIEFSNHKGQGKRNYYGSKKIKTFPVRNFFRYLFRKPLLKPRRNGYWSNVWLYIRTDKGLKNYQFKTWPDAQRFYDDLKRMFEDHYGEEIHQVKFGRQPRPVMIGGSGLNILHS